MKILVTGGLGFIGSNFILKLLKNDDIEITNIDAELYGSDHQNLSEVKNSDKYNFVKGNISNRIEGKFKKEYKIGSEIHLKFNLETSITLPN